MASSSTGSAAVVAQARRDSRQDQITLLRGSAIIALGYGVGAALQSTYVYANLVPEWESVSLGSRLAANGDRRRGAHHRPRGRPGPPGTPLVD